MLKDSVRDQTVIREAGFSDAERIARAHAIASEETYGHYFPQQWAAARNTPEARTQQWVKTLSDYERAKKDPNAQDRIVIAEDNDRVLGFGIFGAARDTDAPVPLELHRLYVLSQTYGTGLAHRLMAAVHPERAASYLWVMEENTRAIAFYRKHGFAPDGGIEHLTEIGNLPKVRMVRRGVSRGGSQ